MPYKDRAVANARREQNRRKHRQELGDEAYLREQRAEKARGPAYSCQRVCEFCGQGFVGHKERRFCSLSCSAKYQHKEGHRPQRAGRRPRHRRINSNGYAVVYVPEHPTAWAGGAMLEHRYVMELHLGRPLRPSEQVHHKNRDKQDNRLENLEIINVQKEPHKGTIFCPCCGHEFSIR